jgi:uncharacterized protein YfaS (alpha-2-macroglobulin family)
VKRYTLPFSLALALASGLAVAQLPSQPKDYTSALELAPSDTVRQRPTAAAKTRIRDLEAWLEANPTSRAHLATDRPLYRPGDTVQAKLWAVTTKGLTPSQGRLQVELVDPRGLVVKSAALDLSDGGGDTSFTLDKSAPGGSWTLRTTLATGQVVERAIVVNTFESPRIKKTMEFVRKGYGPGDTVEAAVTLERATGEKLANIDVIANVSIAGQVLAPIAARTNGQGEVTVRFALPKTLAAPDAMLTVLVDDAGVTESISRAVPITLSTVNMGIYPEGGDLVGGLESRVYIEATDAHGAAVDVEGVVLDDLDHIITNVKTKRDGRGRFSFTPVSGRAYRVRTAQGEYPLPEARAEGCVMRHFDDLEGSQTAVRVRVACTRAQDVTVLATQQEQILDRASFHVDAPTTVYLRSGVSALDRAQGVARVTLFDRAQSPMAERLVFRNKARGMRVSVTTDRTKYGPGEDVALTVRTTDADGRPVPAQVAVSVVDDTLLAFADDDGQSLVSGLLLADLPEPIEGAADWLRPGAEEGGLAVDLALGTRGWRRFHWAAVEGMYAQKLENERIALEAQKYAELGYAALGYLDDAVRGGHGMAMMRPVMAEAAARPAPPMDMPRREAVRSAPVGAVAKAPAVTTETTTTAPRTFAPALPTRVRTDFRDTVLWKPAVTTGNSGTATVRFTLADSITSFRATAEALGSGLLGAGDAMIVSTLPFHVEARMPVALSTGDHLELPITLENQRTSGVELALGVRSGGLLRLGAALGSQALKAGERRTVWMPLDVAPGQGAMEVAIDASGAGVADSLIRTIPVVPRGVPQKWSVSGRLDGPTEHTFTIPKDALEGSTTGTLTLLPTPISEVLTGIEQMVRTPGGCFEQTSSTNWPNVVVLDLLEQAGMTGKLSVDRKQVLDTGYGILKNYQVGNGGFETWGSGPGKEALTAYGLLEFSDMARVYDVSPKLLAESATYLMDQRTGTGGYKVSGASAHGYGTAPPEVLDAYITYALVETGHTNLPKELDQTATLARTSKDPYRMGLATLTLLKARPGEGKAAAARLAGLQAANGSFPGSETSITRSENYNLDVEATALASMALLRAGDVTRAAKAVEWLRGNQTGAGQWGATQGNALALRAIGEMAAAGTRGGQPGQLAVSVDGELVQRLTVAPDGREPIPVDLGKFLTVGSHTVSVTLDGLSVPYALEAGWTTELPVSDAARRLDLTTSLADTTVALGHTARMTTVVTNRTKEVVPDPIARIGLPAGLEAQVKQLEALKKSGEIAFFELRPREVTVYWDGIGVGEVHTVALDLVATNAGQFTAPASAAYPYYDDQVKAWVAGTAVRVTR